MFKLINLTGKNGIGKVAKVSNEDYDIVNKYYWYVHNGYAIGTINKISMHRFILKDDIHFNNKNYVVDHIDGDKLNNTRDNIHYVSKKHNSQNKKKQEKCSSKFIGVSARRKKWIAQCSGFNLGAYNTEEEAAKIYDTFVLLKFGPNAKTNKEIFIKNNINWDIIYDNIKNININSLIKSKEVEKLPNRIYKNKYGYYSKIIINNNQFITQYREILNDAVNDFEKNLIEIEKTEKKKDKFGNTIIISSTGREIIIDDDKWNDLIRYSWNIYDDGYVRGKIKNKDYYLHRYLLNPKKDEIIDHIDNNKANNKLSNLRISTFIQNSQNRNKKQGCSSKYIGVCYVYNKWQSTIKYNKNTHRIGLFNSEIEAAIEYNKKARELYKHKHTKVNKFEIDLNTIDDINIKNKLIEEIEFQNNFEGFN